MKPIARALAAAAVAGVLGFASPGRAEGPPVAERPMRVNRTLLSTGVGVFLVSYGASAAAAAVSPLDSDKKLFVPVLGPWLDLGDRPGGGKGEDMTSAMIITSGVVQTAALLLAVSSLFVPEGMTQPLRRSSELEVRVVPVSLHAGAGLGAVGHW